MEDLNNILKYLLEYKECSFQNRTKKTIKDHSRQLTLVENHLSQLSRDGYIRAYFHPSIGFFWENLKIEADQKVFYSVTKKGIKFLKRGGYN